MRIGIIGAGYVGLVSAACFAEFGVDVVCVDNSPAKIAALLEGRMPIYEPGLEAMVARHVATGHLRFSSRLADALEEADAIFIAVGTPSRRGDGHADLSHVFAAAEEIASLLDRPAVVVTKSTVPVGTGRRLKALMAERRPDLAIEVASNPEFLREGSAIEDFLKPDRVVCGVDGERAQAVLGRLYRPLNLIETPILFTTLETAELIKYANNCFLATKITFINEIADLCERIGADVQQVAKGIGLDGRIGRKFLHAGPGYGGSCFPKDMLALLRTAEELESPLRIIETVVSVNERRKRRMVRKIADALGGSVAGKRVGVLGVTFKPNTDDVRESPSLVIVPALQAEGATVVAFDPEGRHEAEALLPDVVWATDVYGALEGADALVLLTEWNQFRQLDLARARALMNTPVLVDLRNVFDPERAAGLGFAYHGVGRPAVEPVRGATAQAPVVGSDSIPGRSA